MRAPLLIAALFAWVAATQTAHAEHYRFVTLDFPPLEQADAKGQAEGAVVDIVKETMTKLGHKVDIEVLPWARSIQLVKDGKADAVFTAYRSTEREQFLAYSHEVLIQQVVSLYARTGWEKKWTGRLKDLSTFLIGTVSTISYGTRFDEARDQGLVKVDRAEGLDLNFKKLMAGRLDLVISNRYSADVEINHLNLGKTVMELEPPVTVIPSFIGFSKRAGHEKLRDDFDKALHELKASGRYQEILNKYHLRVPQDS